MSTPPNRFELTVRGGPAFGDVTLRGESLAVDFVSGKVRLELVRSDADQAGIPIGRFETRVDPAKLEPLLAEVRAGQLAKYPPPSHGGPGSNEYLLRYRHGDDETGAKLTSRDAATRPEVRALMQAVSDLSFRAMQQPLAALQVTATAQGDRLQVTLENLGTAPVLLTHPARLPGTDDEWCGVRVAELPEERPGFTAPPLAWTELPVPFAERPEDVAPELVLAAKASKSFVTARFAGKAGQSYVAQAVWSSYAPGKAIPGAHRIRGATFSANVIFARGGRD